MSDVTGTFSDLVFAQLRLVDLVERRLRADGGPEVSSYLPLLAISRLEATRVQDVARELGVSVGGASKAVDRLEQAGWVKRKPHPKDRRSATVSLTATGRRQLAKASSSVTAALEEGLALPATRRSQLDAALTQLREVLSAERAAQVTRARRALSGRSCSAPARTAARCSAAASASAWLT